MLYVHTKKRSKTYVRDFTSTRDKDNSPCKPLPYKQLIL